jgi:hypothetical protein
VDMAYYFIDDVSITSVPTVTVVGDPSICSGCPDGPAEFTANATNGTEPYSYSWVPNNGLIPPSGTGNPVEACPGANTTYTVNVTDAIGCTANNTFSLIVNPSPTFTLSSIGSTSICFGQAIGLKVSPTNSIPIPGVIYSWSPTADLNITTGTNVTATPHVTTTYTVTAAAPGGCVSTATITVTVSTDRCCLSAVNSTPYGSFTMGPTGGASTPLAFRTSTVTPGIYDIAPNAIITVPAGTFFMNGVTLRMGKGSEIDVYADVLHITGQSHLYSCSDMWQGIVLEPNSSIYFNTNSWLEDAVIGIEAKGPTASQSGAHFYISSGIFNRNYIHVQVDPVPINSQSTILGSVFTCRDIPMLPVPTVSGLFNTLANLPRLKLQGSNGIGNYSLYRTQVGVLLKSVYGITIGSNSPPAGPNWFDDMEYGIWLQQSGATILGNQFQYMEGRPQGGFNYSGVAIYGQETNKNPVHTITASGNAINDCLRAIDLRGDYKGISLLNNIVDVSQTGYSVPGSGLSIGLMGFSLAPGNVSAITVHGNYITNCKTGMMIPQRSSAVGNTTTFDHNNINAMAGGYCATAMSFSDPSSVKPSSSFTVNNNNFDQVANGIYTMNIFGNSTTSLYEFYLNSCALSQQNVSPGDGIKFVGCQYIETHNNHVHGDPSSALVGGESGHFGNPLTSKPLHVRALQYGRKCRAWIDIRRNLHQYFV